MEDGQRARQILQVIEEFDHDLFPQLPLHRSLDQIALRNVEEDAIPTPGWGVRPRWVEEDTIPPGPYVVVRKFSRNPNDFAFLWKYDPHAFPDQFSPELADCHQALAESGFNWKLESHMRAKAFVKPEHYEPLKEALSTIRHELGPLWVIMEPELEEIVLSKLLRFGAKKRFTLSLGSPELQALIRIVRAPNRSEIM